MRKTNSNVLQRSIELKFKQQGQLLAIVDAITCCKTWQFVDIFKCASFNMTWNKNSFDLNLYEVHVPAAACMVRLTVYGVIVLPNYLHILIIKIYMYLHSQYLSSTRHCSYILMIIYMHHWIKPLRHTGYCDNYFIMSTVGS